MLRPGSEGPIVLALTRGPFVETSLAATRILMDGLKTEATVVLVAEGPPAPAEVSNYLGIQARALGGLTMMPMSGEPAEAILEAVEYLESRLLVLSLPEETAGLGEVRTALLARARCPLLFLPSRMARPLGANGRLLVPLDGTPTTAAVFPLAQAFAQALHATIEILHVATGTGAAAEAGEMRAPRFVDRPQHDWRSWRREFTYRFCDCMAVPGPPVPTQLHVLPGQPDDAILRRAEERPPDLIVLGWHGCLAAGRAHTLFGVLKGSRWPVLTARVSAGSTGASSPPQCSGERAFP